MIKRFLALLLVVGLGSIFATLLMGYTPDQALNLTANYYAANTARDIGSANIVTAIVVTYRGLDTLGEVTVLFLSATVVGLVLTLGEKKAGKPHGLVPVGPSRLSTAGLRG